VRVAANTPTQVRPEIPLQEAQHPALAPLTNVHHLVANQFGKPFRAAPFLADENHIAESDSRGARRYWGTEYHKRLGAFQRLEPASVGELGRNASKRRWRDGAPKAMNRWRLSKHDGNLSLGALEQTC